MPQTTEVDPTAPNAHRFGPLEPEALERWSTFLNWEQTFFPTMVGIVVEEIRDDYCRLRLKYRDELNQPAGIVHGGAIATLIDTVVVPAVAGAYTGRPMLATISMNIDYLAPVVAQDAFAEGWVVKRGRSTVFCQVEVRNLEGELCATASLVYKVRTTPMPALK
jgi:uncharacterized protein (TIGR00369 family)